MGSNSSSARFTDALGPIVRRRISRLNEPMRTRVEFYLKKLQTRKPNGQPLDQRDIDLCFGRAIGDKFEDCEVFTSADVQAINTNGKTLCLQEVIDGIEG